MLLRLFALVLTLLTLHGCDEIEALHSLRVLPKAVQPVGVEFARHETYGFGPGGAETGFTVIRLGDDGAARVAEGGIAWLNAQPPGRIRLSWQMTPVPDDEVWMGRADSAMGAHPAPTVIAILDRYGFGFDLPPEHREPLDLALNAPGSFYAHGPGGLVAVIVPRTRRAYVFYAG